MTSSSPSYHALRGFTLVELAIVMTIIGLLIGGILKGQELLENARTTSTIAQFKSYEAAVTAFKDIYDALPGDGMTDAENRIPGCNANCNTSDNYRAKNGIINSNLFEESLWSLNALPLPPPDESSEGILFWLHLLKANLITGMSDAALTDPTKTGVGYVLPPAKIAYGYLAGQSPNWYPGLLDWNYIVLVGPPTGDDGTASYYNDHASTGDKAVTPARAAQIDRKMDDGKPLTGSVASYSNGTLCHSSFTYPLYSQAEYIESNPGKECVVSYRFQ